MNFKLNFVNFSFVSTLPVIFCVRIEVGVAGNAASSSSSQNINATGERWRSTTAGGMNLGLRPASLKLPHLNNLLEAVWTTSWRQPETETAGLNSLSDGKLYGVQQSGFNYRMLMPYPFTSAPLAKKNVISAISASSRQSTCGAGPTKTSIVEEDRVVGGTEAQPNSWPGVGLLRLDDEFRCGGTLISPTKILTAAHCVYGLWPWDSNRLSADLGIHAWNPSDAKVVKTVSKVAIHPLYLPFITPANDVAVLTLDSPVTYTSTISPVCLPSFGSIDLYAGQSASIVGWGLTSDGGSLPAALQQATIEIVSNDQCATSYTGIASIVSSMLCATSPGIGSCNGDSGGPIFLRSSPGAPWIQAGIVSFGVGCASADFPSVYTRVSSFLPFIMKHMLW